MQVNTFYFLLFSAAAHFFQNNLTKEVILWSSILLMVPLHIEMRFFSVLLKVLPFYFLFDIHFPNI